jgi:type I restriction enzyme S subunit
MESNVLSLTLRGVVNNDPEDPEGQVPSDYSSYQVFEAGDLVFKLIDLENIRTSRVGLVYERGIMSPAYVRLVPGPELEPRFAYYWYYSLYLQHVFNQLGGGVRANLTPTQLLDVHVPVLPLVEQRRIADFLDNQVARIDTLVSIRREQIKALDRLQHARTDALLCGVSRRFVRLSYVARLQSGITVDGARIPDHGAPTPYLRVANVKAGWLNLDEVKTIPLSRQQAGRFALRFGDVLMTEGGDLDKLGRGTMWREEVPGAVHQNHVFAVRPDGRRLLPEFLAHYTSTTPARVHFETTGTKTTNLASTSASKVLDLPIPLPPIDTQQEVVIAVEEVVAATRDLKVTLTRSVDVFAEYKRSLITAAVTGEFDVSSASGRGVPA